MSPSPGDGNTEGTWGRHLWLSPKLRAAVVLPPGTLPRGLRHPPGFWQLAQSCAGTATRRRGHQDSGSPGATSVPPALTELQEHLVLLPLQGELVDGQQDAKLLLGDVAQDVLGGRRAKR